MFGKWIEEDLINFLHEFSIGMIRMDDEFDADDPELVRFSEEKKQGLRKLAVVLMFLFQKLVIEVECQAAAQKDRESISGNVNGDDSVNIHWING